jgi:hypothetical protein
MGLNCLRPLFAVRFLRSAAFLRFSQAFEPANLIPQTQIPHQPQQIIRMQI